MTDSIKVPGSMSCVECTNVIPRFHSFFMFFERHPDAPLGNLREAYMCHACFTTGAKENKKEWHIHTQSAWKIGEKKFLYCNFGNHSHKCSKTGTGHNGYIHWEDTHLTGIVLKESHNNFNDLGMEYRTRYPAGYFYGDCTPKSVRAILDKVPTRCKH